MRESIMKKLDLIVAIVGFLGLIVISTIAIIDSNAEDMMSAVVVQILFASLFIGGYISYSVKKDK